METYIDDVAGGGAADIKGELVELSGTNSSSGDVVLPGAFMRASDVRVYYMTDAGQEAFQKGLPTSQMKEGNHYYLVGKIPYRSTPENFYRSPKEEETRVHQRTNHEPGNNTQINIRKIHKQAPLRIRH